MLNFNSELNSIIPKLTQEISSKPLGLYIHIPFCKDRCTYCSFVTTNNQSRKSELVKKLAERILLWGNALSAPIIETLYIGGGTPSILTIDELRHIVMSVRQAFTVNGLLEATLEANPGTIDLQWLTQAKHLGFDRISLGIQTLDNQLLTYLGRIHDAKAAIEAILLAKQAGFTRISSDLLIGIPKQDLKQILLDVKVLVDAGISHLSLYLLDLDKPCSLKKRIDTGKLQLPEEDEVADIFEVLHSVLIDLGFLHYEISNYASTNQESIHNSKYWNRQPYLGVGPSAASHIGLWRWSEANNIDLWLNTIGLMILIVRY